jgi:hypothetical protein
MEALADSLLEQALLEYDSDAAADEIPGGERVERDLGLRTCAQIFKYALKNRTNSKRALKNHRPQALAPNPQGTNMRWLSIFHVHEDTPSPVILRSLLTSASSSICCQDHCCCRSLIYSCHFHLYLLSLRYI